ncbi:MAG: CRISPR-associated protein Cas4 [Betaproteobacteria bacterium RBG_16_56_24]|nr:MAG: CRISPR-associated protein Cas4 [Betaproteobacteria bacterium RBG_16_56_24]
MNEIADPINVSALNQYTYCPRRCGLIYLESEFSDNIHTSRGNAEHERVDQSGYVTTREGARAEYALPVWSEQLGLIGKCDVVEFWPDGNIYPVEYKHGVRKKRLNDDLQLVAQALCLEEMTGKPILHGAIYHHGSRRRREVAITQELRDKVIDTVNAIRAMMDSGKLPPPANDARCKECSLKEICQPDALAERCRLKSLREELFNVVE